jgi:hypothetical protein
LEISFHPKTLLEHQAGPFDYLISLLRTQPISQEAGLGQFQTHSTTRLFRHSSRHHKKTLALLPQRLVNTGAQIIGTVQDEIILEVREEKANDATAILQETMIEAGKAYLSKVPVEVEVTIGETWAEKSTKPASAS